MRKIVGVGLIGLGVFGIVLAILLPTVVVHASSKTPLDLNITQVSSGSAKLLDAATGKTNTVQLRATRHVRTDSHASDDDNTTVFETLCIVVVRGDTPNCLPASDPRLLSITTDRVTADRRSGESVHVAKYNENINGKAARHQGMSYKFPIDTKKKTYQFFQPDVGKAFPATFEGTAKVRGLDTYKFVSRTGSQPYKILGTLPGTYDDTRTVYVEPQTGTIVNGTERQIQTLASGEVALDTTLAFEDSAVKYQTDYAQSKIDDLRLAKLWAPLVAGIVGVLAIVFGILLLRRGRKAGPDGEGHHRGDAGGPDGGPGYGTPDQSGQQPSYSGSSHT
ncbi:Protein of unknown function [Jatrophihabitans endophyticus]|uniref:DUF3068 domain-containing protein n=1 Tax=Jatrophihabitans endophyticus TaxID=1206085 RepID=A0A1M5CWK0_9ACTN|nr:DUF3068 domain-containing protein [Jatrophihabitans endophyticus]SHF59170.1 Protein of unknown function [Jatrophihabitans endophyticus]